MKKLRYRQAFLPLICLCALCFGCETISEANGSFEESVESARTSSLEVADIPVKRFFRFHLRQFGNDVGGTFETFDMSSYAQFAEVPVYMSNPLSLYYCARIDYGYVRNDHVYVVFTDREQRQWTFAASLGDRRLAGSLMRSSLDEGRQLGTEYLLPEDRAWLTHGEQDRNLIPKVHQIVLSRMEDSKRSLQCMYYFKTLVLHFVLPSQLSLDDCQPSVQNCRSYKLAIGGMLPSSYEFSPENIQYQSVLNAYLDDCDLEEANTRTIRLREDPKNVPKAISNAGLFLATAFVYKDLDQDDEWDPYSEPVLAALSRKSLLFVREVSDTAVYGNDATGTTFETPVIGAKDLAKTPGWNVYSDSASSSNMSWRIVEKMNLGDVEWLNLVLSNEHAPQDGCYMYPTDPAQLPCDSVFPVLMQ